MGVTRTYQIGLETSSGERTFDVGVEWTVHGDEPDTFEITAVTPEGGPDLGPEVVCPRTLRDLRQGVQDGLTLAEIRIVYREADLRERAYQAGGEHRRPMGVPL